MAILAVILPIFVFAVLFYRTTIVRVPSGYIGLPIGLHGRFRGVDQNGHKMILRLPYREGTHLKRPWWSVSMHKLKPLTFKVSAQENRIREGVSNKVDLKDIITVKISGTIKLVPSKVALFRFAEFREDDIFHSILSELRDFFSRRTDGLSPGQIVGMLEEFTGDFINYLDEDWKDDAGTVEGRFVEGYPLSRSEVDCGVKVVDFVIDSVDVLDRSDESRLSPESEDGKRSPTSYTPYLKHLSSATEKLTAKVRDLKESFPELRDSEILNLALATKQSTH